MMAMEFERGKPAQDGIHEHVEFNEYRPKGERMVTAGQIFFGTLAAFSLLAMYVLFSILEG